jgi:hypothetical protein
VEAQTIGPAAPLARPPAQTTALAFCVNVWIFPDVGTNPKNGDSAVLWSTLLNLFCASAELASTATLKRAVTVAITHIFFIRY